jgi:hypothetical protein
MKRDDDSYEQTLQICSAIGFALVLLLVFLV